MRGLAIRVDELSDENPAVTRNPAAELVMMFSDTFCPRNCAFKRTSVTVYGAERSQSHISAINEHHANSTLPPMMFGNTLQHRQELNTVAAKLKLEKW